MIRHRSTHHVHVCEVRDTTTATLGIKIDLDIDFPNVVQILVVEEHCLCIPWTQTHF